MRYSPSTLTKRKFSAGFTIVELMIATSVFSVILLVITAGILSFTHDYYKGITSNNTQLVARAIANEVAQAVQFSKGSITHVTGLGGAEGQCIGNKMYNYLLYTEVVPTSPDTTQHQQLHALVTDDSSCGVTAKNPVTGWGTMTNPRELLGQRMRLAQFDITPVAGATNLYNVTVKVVYGDDDDLINVDTSDPSCKSGISSRFCAVSEITTSVQQRL